MGKSKEPSPDLKTVLRLALKSEDFRKELLRRRADAAKDLGLDLGVEEERQLCSASELELEAMIIQGHESPPSAEDVKERLAWERRDEAERNPTSDETPQIIEVLLRADSQRNLARATRSLRGSASCIDGPMEIQVVDEAVGPLSAGDVETAALGRLLLLVYARTVSESVASLARAKGLTLWVSDDLGALARGVAYHVRARTRPAIGLELLLRRAARWQSLRQLVFESRSQAAAWVGIELNATERQTLDSIPQRQLALMIETFAKELTRLPHDGRERDDPRETVLGIRP